MQKELLKYLAPRDKNKDNNKEYKYITKKIFQTYETNKISSGMYDAVHTWIDNNPDWEYHFFDKDDRRNFIKDNFPKKTLEAYDTLIPGAYKADLWRYCVLYIHGGVYVDSKSELLVSLNDVLSDNLQFLSVRDIDWPNNEFKGYICQAFICARPKHPFLKQVIDMLVANSEKGSYGHDVYSPTGPGLLAKAINIVLKRPCSAKHVAGLNKISGYEYELWLNTDKGFYCTQTIDGRVVFNYSYNGYYATRNINLNKDYTSCWFLGTVYAHGKVSRPTESSYTHDNISKFYAELVKKMYVSSERFKARKQFFVAIKKRHFRFRLIRYLIKYEFVYPLSKLLRLTK